MRYGGRKPDPKVKQAPNDAMSVTVQSGEIVVGDTRMKIRVDGHSDASRTLSKTNERTRTAGEKSTAPTAVRPPHTDSKAGRDAVPVLPGEAPKSGSSSEPLEADSSLGFLAPHASGDSLQASPVPAPGSNASALNIREGAPRPNSPVRISALHKMTTPPSASAAGTRIDTQAPTVREKPKPDSDITQRVSPLPGVQADHTITSGKPALADMAADFSCPDRTTNCTARSAAST